MMPCQWEKKDWDQLSDGTTDSQGLAWLVVILRFVRFRRIMLIKGLSSMVCLCMFWVG